MEQNLLVCASIPREHGYFGGIAVIVSDYIKKSDSFKNHGYNVHFFNLEKEKYHVKSSAFVMLSKFRYSVKELKKTLRLKEYDCIHIHTSRKSSLIKDLMLIHRIRKNYKGKIVVSIHFADINKILPENNIIKKFCIGVLKNDVDSIIFLSQETRRAFINVGCDETKCKVLYTFHNYEYSEEELLDKRKSILSEDKMDLIFIGSIDRRKGILELLEACSRIEKDNFILHICGKLSGDDIGDEFNRLVEQLKDRCVNHGYTTGDEKRHLLNDSKVLILPSYGEGMPIVIMEAMAFGCAVITTKVGAIGEILLSGENALFCEAGNVEDIKNKIIELLKNKELVKNMSENNYEKGKEFSIESNISDLCKIYDSITLI